MLQPVTDTFVPKEELNTGPWGRHRYLKKLPMLTRETVLSKCREVYRKNPSTAAMVCYAFLFGSRVGEYSKYEYRCTYKDKIQKTLNSPAINTLDTYIRPDGYEILKATVRRQKMGRLGRKKMEKKLTNEVEFLKMKSESLDPIYREVEIIISKDGVKTVEGEFAEILRDYITLRYIKFNPKNEFEEMKFAQQELFPFSRSNAQQQIQKYFGINSHFLRRMSATWAVRIKNFSTADLKYFYGWLTSQMPDRYIESDKTSVMIRSIEAAQKELY
jgi:hypothetical protein